MIFSAFSKALSQLSDPRFRRVLFMGIGLTLLLFLVVFFAVFHLIGWLVGDSVTIPWIGQIDWVGSALSWSSIPLMFIASTFLMVPVASAFTSLFLDQVADAVEDRHYPDLPDANQMSFAEGLRDSISFLGVIVVANLCALILYIIFTPLAPVIFCVMNGYLLGVEYFQLAAMRRMSREAAIALRKKHILTIFSAGILMAMPLSIPLVGLIIPILGAATFTHLFHKIVKR